MRRLLHAVLLLAIVASSLFSAAGTADARSFGCALRNITWEKRG